MSGSSEKSKTGSKKSEVKVESEVSKKNSSLKLKSSTSDCGDPKVRNDIHKRCVRIQEEVKSKPDPCENLEKSGVAGIPGKEVVPVVTTEGTRYMIVPSKEKNVYPITLELEEFQRLKDRAVYYDEKERIRQQEELENEKKRLEDESYARKSKLQSFIVRGRAGPGPKLSDLEQEAKDKANYLLKRAWDLRMEQEDEIKLANSLILKTKCQAIRDAQVAEKKLIEEEWAKENKRIDQMMEDERLRIMKIEGRGGEKEVAKKSAYIKGLKTQMEERELLLDIEKTRKAEEAKRMKEAYYEMLRDEMAEAKRVEKEKEKLREEFNQANDQLGRYKEIEREEDRQSDLRMQEYMRLKGEREEAYENEVKERKKKKEEECARLRALQEKAGDLQAMADEMAAVRRQEDYEREWRRKEMEVATKRKKGEEDLIKGRKEQIIDQRRYRAFELQREKREFERILKVQLKDQEKDRLKELKRRYDLEIYRDQILKQINEKERDRIQLKQKKFEEGLEITLEEAQRTANLKKAMSKKVDELRQSKVPEHYVIQMERQLKLHE